jgi:hypothetical protein
MCFEPVTIAIVTGALTAAASGVAGYLQTKSQNQAAVHQYKFQQKQQELVNKASVEQYNEALARQRLDTQRQGQQALEQAQTNILDIQRRQAAATANAATAGITGTPLDMLFNEFQVSVGNVASNLQTHYRQLNENLFFGADNSRREAQSRINSAIPAQPYLASFNPLPSLLQGAATGVGMMGSIPPSNPKPVKQSTVPGSPDGRIPIEPPSNGQPPVPSQPTSFVYQGWKYS